MKLGNKPPFAEEESSLPMNAPSRPAPGRNCPARSALRPRASPSAMNAGEGPALPAPGPKKP